MRLDDSLEDSPSKTPPRNKPTLTNQKSLEEIKNNFDQAKKRQEVIERELKNYGKQEFDETDSNGSFES